MTLNRRWELVFFAASLALLVALVGSANALADDYTCTGMLGAVHVDNLRVQQNAACTLNDTIVDGNIFVETNATLYAYNVQVDGNIQADNAALVNVYAGSFVGGNIQIKDSGTADIQSVDIDRDLYFDENSLFLNAANNTIGGNLQAFNNTGGVSINGNTIDGNLQCKANFPPPTGTGNIVKGSMEDQCANFGGDPNPAPTSTPTVAISTPSAPTSTPTVPINDLEAPTVRWIAPVLAGERFDLREGEQVFLEVEASDNVSIGQVRFFRWDAVNELYVTIGTLVQPPYRIQVSTSTLNPDWNQVFVIASDLARNNSGSSYIWLYKLAEGGAGYQVYLPFTGK